GDVVADGAMHQHRFLADDAELGAQRALRQVANVVAIEQNTPPLNIEQAQHEVDDGGLACAGGAYQSDPFAGADLEVQVLDDSFFLAVMEGNIRETDIACSLVHDARIRRILDGRTLRDDAGRILYRRIGADKAVDVEHHVARHLVQAENQAHSSSNRSSGGVAT